jgi:hypothetical protein
MSEAEAGVAKKATLTIPLASTVVKLEKPVEYDGVIYSEITVRESTAGEVSRFMEAISRASEGGDAQFVPLGIDMPVDVWSAVYDAMWAEDGARLNKAIDDFTPSHLKAVAERIFESGANTSPS